MSDPIRVGVVTEGPTDAIVIRAALKSILQEREFVFQVLQPERSRAFAGIPGNSGVGWAGVYRWCHQAADEGGGQIIGSMIWRSFDIVVIHLDADVAEMNYQSASIPDAADDLPCRQPCPPASATTDALRRVVLRWTGLERTPSKMVFCTPSYNMDAWTVAVLLPLNRVIQRSDWECFENPSGQFNTAKTRPRFKQTVVEYEAIQSEVVNAWPRLRRSLSEAERFSADVEQNLP